MRWLSASLVLPIAACLAAPAAAQSRAAVDASAPDDLSVTVYRDPQRGEFDEMNRDWPEGFAMISETRTVTLPPGESTIRFEGVAEGMVAVTAIVTGLPGGTIEKNRNAELLSPGALVNGTLGNRVRITRTNPGTGEQETERAIVRTRADGGLVLQTDAGFEAVSCSGLPEKLTFDRVPAGLSARPVFSIDTRDPAGGTYTIVLTYLAWGFDWDAHYVARLGDSGANGKTYFDLLSWLTILNDNGQSFEDANLMAVAGTLNVESDFEGLADPPEAPPLRLLCYPLGSTALGTPVSQLVPPPPPPPPMAMAAPMADYSDMEQSIVVTGSRVLREELAMVASEEQLGDLKLYRIPERVTVSAQGQKQIAFLNRQRIEGEFVYELGCDLGGWVVTNTDDWDEDDDGPELESTRLLLETVNDEDHGLGVALPQGGVTVFEPSSRGPLLIAEERFRDYAVTQDVELELASESWSVRGVCGLVSEAEGDRLEEGEWAGARARLVNVGSRPATVRLRLGWAGDYEYRTGRRKPRLKDGEYVIEVEVGAGETRDFDFRARDSDTEDS
ncbi:hypothetical protein [Qipengyuania sp. JC766]|uniref:DUF4139 domain-containing protein n=1 Tax=Qipengyuania sp. JC766 TaxID=3232139 RepID=UPI003458B446